MTYKSLTKKWLLILPFFAILSSCTLPEGNLFKATYIMPLPPDLPTSLLLVEKWSTTNFGGKKKLLAKTQIRTAKMYNAEIEKQFANYPFEYKLVDTEEIGDNISKTKRTYLLHNGDINYSYSSNGGTMNNTRHVDIEMLLEDLATNQALPIGHSSSGIAKGSYSFVLVARKQFALQMIKSK